MTGPLNKTSLSHVYKVQKSLYSWSCCAAVTVALPWLSHWMMIKDELILSCKSVVCCHFTTEGDNHLQKKLEFLEIVGYYPTTGGLKTPGLCMHFIPLSLHPTDRENIRNLRH